MVGRAFVRKPPYNPVAQHSGDFQVSERFHAGRVTHPNSMGKSSCAWGPPRSCPAHPFIWLFICPLPCPLISWEMPVFP